MDLPNCQPQYTRVSTIWKHVATQWSRNQGGHWRPPPQNLAIILYIYCLVWMYTTLYKHDITYTLNRGSLRISFFDLVDIFAKRQWLLWMIHICGHVIQLSSKPHPLPTLLNAQLVPTPLLSHSEVENSSFVPRLPDLFSFARERGEPDKTYHVCDIRWNQLPYVVQ